MTRTWITLLTGESYLPGVIALEKSRRLVRSAYPLRVAHTHDLTAKTRAALDYLDLDTIRLAPYAPPGADPAHYLRPEFHGCWAKLRLWQLEEYTRIGYLDADMLLLRNMDHVLDGDDFAAALDCFCWAATAPPGHHFGTETGPEFAARCPRLPGRPAYFNAGMFACSPDPALFAYWAEHLASVDVSQYLLAEQDFLNEWLGWWGFTELPYTYNATWTVREHHPETWNLDDVHALHYVGLKPWDELTSRWHAVYRGDAA